jgi:SAM-dependent methyltransferase
MKHIIWGVGHQGLNYYKKNKNKFTYLIDSNPAKIGTKVFKKKILFSSDILNKKNFKNFVYHVCCISDANIIKSQLISLGVPEKNIRTPFINLKFKHALKRTKKYYNFLKSVQIKNKNIIEFGFGGHLYLALICLLLGAKSVTLTNNEKYKIKDIKKNDYLNYWKQLEKIFQKKLMPYDKIFKKINFIEKNVSIENFKSSKKYDIVTNTGVMEHVNNPKKAIKNMRSILKKNGHVFCGAIGIHDHRSNVKNSMFNPWSFLSIPTKKWNNMKKNSYHQNRFRASDFKNIFEKNNFKTLVYKTKLDNSLKKKQFNTFVDQFKKYSLHELKEMDLYILCKKI